MNYFSPFTISSPIPIPYSSVAPQYTPQVIPIKPEQSQSYPNVNEEPKSTKRKRTEEDFSEISSVSLSREKLLKFSSHEYEEYIKKLSKERILTSSETREVKRQRRLIKNREYAQTSRNKKKELVDQMEIQLEQVNNKNKELLEQVQILDNRVKELETTNHRLQEENSQLKANLAALTQGQLLSQIPNTTNCIPKSPPSSPSTDDSVEQYLSSLTDSEEASNSPPVTNSMLGELDTSLGIDDSLVMGDNVVFSNWPSSVFSATSFFVVLFFFGLFLGNIPFNTTPSLPTPKSIHQPAITDPIFQTNYPSDIPPTTMYTGRVLLSSWEKNTYIQPFSSNTSICSMPLSINDVFLDEKVSNTLHEK